MMSLSLSLITLSLSLITLSLTTVMSMWLSC